MRQVGINKTLNTVKVTETDECIVCPMGTKRDGRCYCVPNCAWFRISPVFDMGKEQAKCVCAYCGDKIIGELI